MYLSAAASTSRLIKSPTCCRGGCKTPRPSEPFCGVAGCVARVILQGAAPSAGPRGEPATHSARPWEAGTGRWARARTVPRTRQGPCSRALCSGLRAAMGGQPGSVDLRSLRSSGSSGHSAGASGRKAGEGSPRPAPGMGPRRGACHVPVLGRLLQWGEHPRCSPSAHPTDERART